MERQAEWWKQRVLTNAELAAADLSAMSAAELGSTFDLHRLWGPACELSPVAHPGERPDGGWETARLTLLRTWLAQQERAVYRATQDYAGTDEKAMLGELAEAVKFKVQQPGVVEDETEFIATVLAGSGRPHDIYDDPTGRTGTSLLAGLMSQPSSVHQQPLENQFSEVLAFLISRLPSFARELVMRCAEQGDETLRVAASTAAVIGARTQITMPATRDDGSPRSLYPDISIEGSARSFQLLLEVKVDADFHETTVAGHTLSQPAAYVDAWRRIRDPQHAHVRRVATLTPDPAEGVAHVSSVTWRDVAELLTPHIAASEGVPEVALIVEETRSAINTIIYPAQVEGEEWELIQRVAPTFMDAFSKVLYQSLQPAPGSQRLRIARDFAGSYFGVQLPEGPARLWVYLAPKGGRYNRPDSAASVGLQFMTDSNGTLPDELVPASLRAHMNPVRDIAGWRRLRRYEPLPVRQTLDADAYGRSLAARLVADLLD